MAPAEVAGPLVTPDGRYILVRGRLWRHANPSLPKYVRQALVIELMAARRAVAGALREDDPAALRQARDRVQAAKATLGERGPVWWKGGAPDQNRHLATNSSYADRYAGLPGDAPDRDSRVAAP